MKIILSILLLLSFIKIGFAQDIYIKSFLQKKDTKESLTLSFEEQDREVIAPLIEEILKVEVFFTDTKHDVLLESIAIKRPSGPILDGIFPTFEILGKFFSDSEIDYVYQKGNQTVLSIIERKREEYAPVNSIVLEGNISFREASIAQNADKSINIILYAAGGRKIIYRITEGKFAEKLSDNVTLQSQSRP